MSDENKDTVQVQPAPIQIEVPAEVAIQIKIMEFDKAIADSEAQTAALKQQKMAFILDRNLAAIQAQYQKPVEPPVTTPEAS